MSAPLTSSAAVRVAVPGAAGREAVVHQRVVAGVEVHLHPDTGTVVSWSTSICMFEW